MTREGTLKGALLWTFITIIAYLGIAITWEYVIAVTVEVYFKYDAIQFWFKIRIQLFRMPGKWILMATTILETDFFLFSHQCFSKSTNLKSQFECMWLPSAFFSIFSCCSESGNQPQEDLAKSSSKTNAEIQNLAILLHVAKS